MKNENHDGENSFFRIAGNLGSLSKPFHKHFSVAGEVSSP